MSGLGHPIPLETRASAKIPKHRDTSATCRERATADLLKSVVTITANERLTLERSAANWELRAQLLDRVEETDRARGEAAARGLQA
jgi:hypothetical protein